MIEPVASALVVVAKSFNPSIFTQLWLCKEGIVDEEDFQGLSLASDDVAQHQLSTMQLLVVPPRLQVTLKPGDDASAEAGRALVDKIVNKLPHTPFQALGMNLDFLVTLEGADFAQRDRELFLVAGSPLASAFSDGDPRFGGYFSRDIDGIRLKLDIKPFAAGGEVGAADKLRCCFNHHVPLGKGSREEKIAATRSALGRCDDLRRKARKLVEDIESYASRS